MGQDTLLLSSPAERARARHVALAYAELVDHLAGCFFAQSIGQNQSSSVEVNSELEYVGISADTTEADLKQLQSQSQDCFFRLSQTFLPFISFSFF